MRQLLIALKQSLYDHQLSIWRHGYIKLTAMILNSSTYGVYFMISHFKKSVLFSLVLLALLSANVKANTRIAILDFELSDVTLAPGIPAEIERTGAIKAMLEAELKKAGYIIIPIDLAAQHQANAGFGYLFNHNDVAAALARKAGAEYVLVGRLHKPSFLFAYLMGHLIKANDGGLIENYVVETKGGESRLTLKAVETLTSKIDYNLDKSYSPPPPVSKSVYKP